MARLVELAELSPGLRVLEPSAGRGAIASALESQGCVVDCVELLPDNAQALIDASFQRVALTAAIWHNDKTEQPVKRSLVAFDH